MIDGNFINGNAISNFVHNNMIALVSLICIGWLIYFVWENWADIREYLENN